MPYSDQITAFAQAQLVNAYVSLDGRTNRPYPFVPITVIGPIASIARDAAIDTMADDTVFPEDLAHKIGYDPKLHSPDSLERLRAAAEAAGATLVPPDKDVLCDQPAAIGKISKCPQNVLSTFNVTQHSRCA